MNDFREEVSISLFAERPSSRKNLHEALIEMGYKSEDDFYFVPREDTPQPWQSINLLALDVKCRGEPKYETKEDVEEGISTEWDEVVISYLIATIPPENIEKLLKRISDLVDVFKLNLRFEDVDITIDEFRHKLISIADQIEAKYARPGSEDLSILIECRYI